MTGFSKGDVLFEQELPSSGRGRVALFSEATEDPNLIHFDETFAKNAGFTGVLQQGPMTTAQFARLLTDAAGKSLVRTLDVTFTAPVYPDDVLTLRAEVIDAGPLVRCALTARRADGTQIAKGIAELGVM
ncbi:MAG: MaoC family dehydratase [Bradyrhizobium sp.]